MSNVHSASPCPQAITTLAEVVNVTAVATVLFVVGVVAFKQGGQTRMRDLGRVAIGTGLMLLSLHILLDSCSKRHGHVETLA